MQFEPKIIPEGINSSQEHPLRELLVLVSSLAVIVVVIGAVLAASADYFVRFIPLEKENLWFSSAAQAINLADGAAAPAPLRQEVIEYLQQIVDQLRDPEKTGYRFRVSLIDDEEPNAFVFPGGHIVVTSGLLGVVQSENGLAMVLAHEMAHQYQRHPLRALGRGLVLSLAMLAVSGVEGGGLADIFIGNATTLTSLGFNRQQEREADSLGVALLTRHYGHASGASEFFDEMNARAAATLEMPEFLGTHPALDQRIEMLRAFDRDASGATTPLGESVARYLESGSSEP